MKKEFIKKEPELIEFVEQTPELVKLAIDSGLKDNRLIYIPKEEILEYINLAIDSELKDKEFIYIPKEEISNNIESLNKYDYIKSLNKKFLRP